MKFLYKINISKTFPNNNVNFNKENDYYIHSGLSIFSPEEESIFIRGGSEKRFGKYGVLLFSIESSNYWIWIEESTFLKLVKSNHIKRLSRKEEAKLYLRNII